MKYFIIVASILFLACELDSNKPLQITRIANPCIKGGEGNIFCSKHTMLYLSWIEYVNDSLDELRFTRLEGGEWATPKTIVSGTNWFVNWADFPSLVANEKQLAAHWLQKSATGTYDYDVHITQSNNDGTTWTSSFIPHRDSIAAEHGFVSLLPLPNTRFFATWLDGRHTKTNESTTNTPQHGHEHTGAMSLRTAEFDANGNLYEEAELDARICDCCQTAAALTNQGPIVVYRDRSEEEIRDISIVRKVDGAWRTPKSVYNDQWKIAGCPVNGPAVAAIDEQVAVAWFTIVQDSARVQVAFSTDAGANFDKPIQLNEASSEGRVDILLWEKDLALVSWIERIGEEGELKLAKVHSTKGVLKQFSIASIGLARSSGFPRMERLGKQLFMVWTDTEKEQIQTLLIEGL